MFDEEEDIVTLSDKEEEIENYYKDEEEYEDYSDYDEDVEDYVAEEEESDSEDDSDEEEYEEFHDVGVLEEDRRSRRVRNILIAFVILIAALIIVDIIAVSKFDKGPFFAIPLKKYNDGGTKEYYGLGYKVIKYHQVQGRRDKSLGFWTLEYNTNALTVKDKEIATTYANTPLKAYQKYRKKFVRIKSTLQEVNANESTITMKYDDDNDKYDLTIMCDVVKDQINLTAFEIDKKITIIGTVKEFKTKNNNMILYVSNCFAEQ